MDSIEARPNVTPRLELRGLGNSRAGPFDLVLEPGGSLAITGPSGAGKSVLLRMIADLDPNEGDVLLDGRSRALFTGPDWRRQVVYTAAEPGWWLELVGEHFGPPPMELASRLGLRTDIFERPVRLCSTGERQRLALIRSLVAEPLALLLDEPTASLDADNVARVEALLRERRDRGMALLLVTHDPAQAARLGDTHRQLAQGRLMPA
jgi:ABC-type iron transport system FetAB ATPase subunit